MQLKGRAALSGLIAAVALLLIGALVAWSYHAKVAKPMQAAHAAFARGDWAESLGGYRRTKSAIDGYGWLKSVLREDYADALMGETQSLYADNRLDDAIAAMNREAERSPEIARDPRRLLWSGNVWFRKAIKETRDVVRRDLLNSAVDFYRKGLEVAPDNWNIKFNYELASIVLARENPLKREKRDEEQKKRVLPRIRTDQERQRRVLPPEERG